MHRTYILSALNMQLGDSRQMSRRRWILLSRLLLLLLSAHAAHTAHAAHATHATSATSIVQRNTLLPHGKRHEHRGRKERTLHMSTLISIRMPMHTMPFHIPVHMFMHVSLGPIPPERLVNSRRWTSELEDGVVPSQAFSLLL